jgi:hypothetical protein
MGFFECCHVCKPPKRSPGCHSKCPEYLKQKKLWDEHQEAKNKAWRGEIPVPYAWKESTRRKRGKY